MLRFFEEIIGDFRNVQKMLVTRLFGGNTEKDLCWVFWENQGIYEEEEFFCLEAKSPKSEDLCQKEILLFVDQFRDPAWWLNQKVESQTQPILQKNPSKIAKIARNQKKF